MGAQGLPWTQARTSVISWILGPLSFAALVVTLVLASLALFSFSRFDFGSPCLLSVSIALDDISVISRLLSIWFLGSLLLCSDWLLFRIPYSLP